MSQERIVFVHGRGSTGAAAWPRQHRLAGRYDCLFLKRHGFDVAGAAPAADYAADERIVLEKLKLQPVHLVAAGEGAVAAMMAAVECPERVLSLALFEPACFSLTADLPATREHRKVAGSLSSPPWEAPLQIVPGVPTLVVTGGWEPLYEEVAHYLASTGAQHRHAGGDHRPQDTEEGHRKLTEFLAAH